jgi:Contractile injection system tube protein/LysM domain
MTASATIQEWNLVPGSAGARVTVGDAVNLTVDFDPQSLELTYSATGAAAQQTKSPPSSAQLWNKSPEQQTGQTTTLSMTLIFDDTETPKNVQLKTNELVKLTLPSKSQAGGGAAKRRVVKFSWGGFLFFGSVTSMTQTIDFFAPDGTPKRASVHLSLQEVGVPIPDPPATPGPGAPNAAAPAFGANAATASSPPSGPNTGPSPATPIGTTPLTLSQAGDTVQGIMGRAGVSTSWQAVAAANNIDNPRLLPAGSVLDLSAGAG